MYTNPVVSVVGNWMWLSASSFFYQYFRVYSPVTYGKKYDKDGAFVRHFLPVLKVSTFLDSLSQCADLLSITPPTTA